MEQISTQVATLGPVPTLTTLPAEVRLGVYSYLFLHSSIVINQCRQQAVVVRSDNFPSAILLVNRQLYEECHDLLYEHTTLDVLCKGHFPLELKSYAKTKIRHLRTVHHCLADVVLADRDGSSSGSYGGTHNGMSGLVQLPKLQTICVGVDYIIRGSYPLVSPKRLDATTARQLVEVYLWENDSLGGTAKLRQLASQPSDTAVKVYASWSVDIMRGAKDMYSKCRIVQIFDDEHSVPHFPFSSSSSSSSFTTSPSRSSSSTALSVHAAATEEAIPVYETAIHTCKRNRYYCHDFSPAQVARLGQVAGLVV